MKNRCPICQGYQEASHTTFTVDLGTSLVVVRHVPAIVCEQCGAEWIDDSVSEKLEEIVLDVKQKKSTFEVADYSNLLKAS